MAVLNARTAVILVCMDLNTAIRFRHVVAPTSTSNSKPIISYGRSTDILSFVRLGAHYVFVWVFVATILSVIDCMYLVYLCK